MRINFKPLIMGLVMGPMMLWMLHGQLTGQTLSGIALALFIGAHAVMIGGVIGVGLFAARLSPRLRGWGSRFQRPSPRHLGWMLTGMILSTSAIHVSLHGLS